MSAIGPAESRPGVLQSALDADRLAFEGLACYVAGTGPPMLLIHSVNAAASAAEVRPLFEHFRATRTVFAPDLPGYGFSERSDRAHTPRSMTDALHRIVSEVRRRCGEAPIDAIGVSLGCEFVARAAAEHATAFGRLALVSPTGLTGTKPRRGEPCATREVPGMLAMLRCPLWAADLYRGLTRPGVVRYFLERTWGGKGIDETMYRYAVHTARQPGARFAPQQFLCGRLFSADIHDVYDSLPGPVWMSHGVRGDFTDFRGLALLREGRRWQRSEYPTGALPYFERPGEFLADADAFFGEARSPSASSGAVPAAEPRPSTATARTD